MLAHESSLRVGMRVYAVGAPRRLEQTISDGLLSALRRGDAGELQLVQTSAPISPGSSGGGLFDAHGRLIGITTSGLKESQNLNFAMPARWISDLARRNEPPILRIAVAPPFTPTAPAVPTAPTVRTVPAAPAAPSAPAAPTTPVTPAAPAAPVAPPAATLEGPSRIEYLVTDRLTRKTRRAVFVRDTPGTQGALSFNQGSWIESATGDVTDVNAAIAGEFDTVTPPGGWGRADLADGLAWSARYDAQRGSDAFRMELDARARRAPAMQVMGRSVEVLRIDYAGYMHKLRTAGVASNNQSGPYKAVAWYAPALRRVLRFEAQTRGGASGSAFHVDEVLELVDLR